MIDIDFKFPDWAAKLRKKEDEINRFIAAQIQFNRGQLFDTEGRYNGRPGWEPLKFRSGQILSKRGTLRKSIAPYNPKGRAGPNGIVRFASDAVIVGTKLIYARMMNDGTTKMPGGVLRPVRAKALKIPLPRGKSATDVAKSLSKSQGKTIKTEKAEGVYRNERVIFRKSVRIPARPFVDWNSEDQAELDAALINKFAELLNE